MPQGFEKYDSFARRLHEILNVVETVVFRLVLTGAVLYEFFRLVLSMVKQ